MSIYKIHFPDKEKRCRDGSTEKHSNIVKEYNLFECFWHFHPYISCFEKCTFLCFFFAMKYSLMHNNYNTISTVMNNH